MAVSRPSPATPPLSPPPPPPPRLSPATPCASGLSSSSLHRLGLGLAQRAGAVGRTEAHLCRRQLSPRLAATRPSGPAAKPLRAWRLGHLRLLWRPRLTTVKCSYESVLSVAHSPAERAEKKISGIRSRHYCRRISYWARCGEFR